MHSPLRPAVLACHAALILLLATATLAGGITSYLLCAAAVIVAPLLIAAYALLRRRNAERWLAVLLVPYAGALSVEVVARAGGAPLLSAALLTSVLELGLLLALIRASRPPAVRE